MSTNSGRGPGKPTVITPDVIGLLVASFQNGLNVVQACWQAKIGRDAYYDRCNRDPDFADKMERARQYLSMKGRMKVKEAVESGDMKTIRWYLERKDKDEFSSRTEVTGRNGQSLTQRLEPEEKAKLDKIWARKHGATDSTGDDQPADPGSGGDESQGVPS